MDFHEQDDCDDRFIKSCGAWFSMKVSAICELCVIMGITAGLLGRSLRSTRGLNANDYVIGF